MIVEYHKWWSANLGRDMELKTYGQAGQPLLVFPCAGGRFYEAEDFQLIQAIQSFIDQGQVRVYTVDSVDNESWLANWKWPGDRAWRHEQYDRYVLDEVRPFIEQHGGSGDKLIAVGASMGGYHAANSAFRHPEAFDTCIALSGLYGPEHFVGTYRDEHVQRNFPLLYLPGLKDLQRLDQLRGTTIVVCVGQGAWEEMHVRETQQLEGVLQQLDIPAWFDYWGRDVNHDWPWWRLQLPYFLGKLDLPPLD